MNRQNLAEFGNNQRPQVKKKQESESAVLPEYVSANYLNPFISPEIEEKLKAPIKYISKAGAESDRTEFR